MVDHLEDARQHRLAGRVAEAAAAYWRALKRDPSLAEAHRGLGDLALGAGRGADAITHLEAPANLAPADPALQFLIGNLLLGHGLGVLCDRQIAARRGPGTDCAEGIQQHGCRAARQAGIGAERLIFARRLPHERHLARLALADPALDTIFHAGGVTTIDALWAGVPVVTWAGVTHPARTGASILHDAGLPELVAPTLDRYRDIALQLARDPAALQGLRQRLARHKDKAPLFKPESLARHLERTFRLMVEQARSEEAPRAIVVPPLP